MIYEYLCTNEECSAITERVQRMSEERPEAMPCKYCQSVANFKISAPAVLTAGMSNQKFDVAVGQDAEKRWKNIRERQETRDKVRKDNNQVGIVATGYNDFQPISEQQRQVRTNVTKAVERDGFRAESES